MSEVTQTLAEVYRDPVQRIYLQGATISSDNGNHWFKFQFPDNARYSVLDVSIAFNNVQTPSSNILFPGYISYGSSNVTDGNWTTVSFMQPQFTTNLTEGVTTYYNIWKPSVHPLIVQNNQMGIYYYHAEVDTAGSPGVNFICRATCNKSA